MTFRTGYVRKMGKFVFKLLYGEGFQEPSPRVLYGAWEGLGSDPELKPEESRTLEISTTYMVGATSHLLSLYRVKNSNTILNLQEGARNVGSREIYGLDYHFKWSPRNFSPDSSLYLWGYYSYIHARGDEIYDPVSDGYLRGEVGDIAPHKIYLGVTGTMSKQLTLTLLGRYVSRRNTVATNPVESVGAYAVLDGNLLVKDIFVKGLSVSLRVTNIFDSLYYHPGIRTANSGEEPGYFDDEGIWRGSAGWLNSLLPQFGRNFLLSLNLEF